LTRLRRASGNGRRPARLVLVALPVCIILAVWVVNPSLVPVSAAGHSESHAAPACIACPSGTSCYPNCSTGGGGCTPTYTTVSIEDISVVQKALTFAISWTVSPNGGSAWLDWGSSTVYGYSIELTGGPTYSVSEVTNVVPGATTYYEIYASAPESTCTKVYYPNSYESSVYVPSLYIWTGSSDASSGFSGATPQSGLCSSILGGGGSASSTPSPPSVSDSTATTEFYLTAKSDTCAAWQITASGGFYMPSFEAPSTGSYTFTFAWYIAWNTAFECFISPLLPGSSAGSQGNLQILGNLNDPAEGANVLSNDPTNTIVSWNQGLYCAGGSSGDQQYADSFTVQLTGGVTYAPFTYVQSWIYTEATGDASSQIIMNVGETGDYAQLSWDSLLWN